MKAVKVSKIKAARDYGREAAAFARRGLPVTARRYASIAAHFGRLALDEARRAGKARR